MTYTSRVARLLCLGALGLAAKLPAQVTVGVADPNTGNSIPFGTSTFGTEYQQIYSSTAFPGLFTISSLDFFHTQFFPGSGTYAPGTYNIFFGTSTSPITAIDPIFANNRTSPLIPFATLVIAPGTSAAAPTLNISGTPFLYDPSLGNLLLDIQYSNTSTALFLDFDHDAAGLMSRAYGSGTSGSVNNGVGLVTRFNGVTAPEPTTLALGATGLVVVGGMARWRRRKSRDAARLAASRQR